MDRLAYEDAVAHYLNALGAMGDSDQPRRCRLLLDLADAHARAGDTPSSKLVYGEAAALAEDQSLPEQLAEAAIGYGGRLIWEVSRDDPDVLALLERALERIGDADSPLARADCSPASAAGRCATTTTPPDGARSPPRRSSWRGGSTTRRRWPMRSTASSRRTTRPTTRSSRSSSPAS